MASVRMSNDLRATIRRNAMQAFDVSTPEPQFATADINSMVDAVLESDAQATLSAIAQSYEKLPKTKSSWSYNRELKHAFGFNPPTETKVNRLTFILEPRNDANGHRTTVDLNRAVHMYSANQHAELSINVIDDPMERARILEMLNKYEKRHQDYKSARQNYHATIDHLLDECTTLKQFLTAWPAGESFVPAEKVTELHTKVTRIQKARQIKEDIMFDDTAINKVVLTAKLMGN
jgi:hypothetical protein